ncbi:tryptophan halogenase family protein [Sphingomonas sp.]|uniref:tryptophan halogenase family protein n=1 Tax=Sphingomonas sp. TaxID=28214 RepID=UPI003BAB1C4B
MAPDIKNILILGGGTAGWACAAVLAQRSAEHGVSLTVVDAADIPTIGVGEATIPTIYDLLNHVGMTDSEVVKAAQATFKYGIQFEGWSRPGEIYMHGFGTTGTPRGEDDFFTAWLGGGAYFSSRTLDAFTPAVAAARKGRFARVAERPAGAAQHLYYPLCELSYALHFDAALLARELRANALRNGVVHRSSKIVAVETGERGIAALRTGDGELFEADFFIDCSGLTGVLSRAALGGTFEDWRAYLPCDRAIAVQTARSTAPNPYTRSIAHRAGWRWEIQLQSRTGNGCVYSSDHMSDDEATDLLMSEVAGEPINQPRRIDFRTGRLAEPWEANCVALGLAAGFLEPLESTSIHLISKYALLLEQMLFDNAGKTDDRGRFNAMWRAETEEIRDFLSAHYVVNQRDEPFWTERRDAKRPPSLDRKLQAFAQTGWFDLPDHALFGHDSWFQVLIGQGFALDYPQFAIPRAEAPGLLQFLQNVARAVDVETSAIPRSHQQVIHSLVEGG